MITKVKTKVPCFGLEIGSEFVLNKETNRFEHINNTEHVYEDGTINKTSNFVSVSTTDVLVDMNNIFEILGGEMDNNPFILPVDETDEDSNEVCQYISELEDRVKENENYIKELEDRINRNSELSFTTPAIFRIIRDNPTWFIC